MSLNHRVEYLCAERGRFFFDGYAAVIPPKETIANASLEAAEFLIPTGYEYTNAWVAIDSVRQATAIGKFLPALAVCDIWAQRVRSLRVAVISRL